MVDSGGVALVVDDVEANRVLFSAVLEGLGLTVLTGNTGRDAVNIVSERMNSKERIDVLFLDMMMPDVNGIQATTQIRELGFVGPILMFSAETSRQTANRALEAGANYYFVKTTFSADLARALIEKFCFLKLS